MMSMAVVKRTRKPASGGGVAQGDGQVAFAQADAADEDGVGLVLDELEAEEVLDLEAVDLGGPGEVELLEGLEDGEAGLLDAALACPVLAAGGLAFDQAAQEVDVGPLVFGGLGGQFLAVLLHERQVQSRPVAGGVHPALSGGFGRGWALAHGCLQR